MADPRTGRAWHELSQWIINRDRTICWRCGRPGADTAGHILPVATHPQLALDPDNLRAEHGTRRRLEIDGFDCQGNFSAGADAGRTIGAEGNNSIVRRHWLRDDTDE